MSLASRVGQELYKIINGLTNIVYDNTTSGLTSTTVKGAIDEVVGTKVSKVASSVLLSGNVVIADTAITKNFAAVTYTGNGTSQDIVTGISSVDFTVSSNGSGYWLDRSVNQVKTDAGTVQASGSCVVNTSKVHIKGRSYDGNHVVNDGLRGTKQTIFTHITNTEDPRGISAFTTTGFSFDDTGGGDTNASLETYIAYQTLYTHMKWGVTSQGKFQIEAYNPVTREGMIYYLGSGVSGHQISHSQGVELDYREAKNLTTADAWGITTPNIEDGSLLLLNGTSAIITSGDFTDTATSTHYITGTSIISNKLDNEHIMYYKAKSETFTIGTYNGTGVAGNFIETKDVNGVARKPRRIIIKAISAVGDWVVYDTARLLSDNAAYMADIYLNLSQAEPTTIASAYAIKIPSSDGFEAESIANYLGGQYLYLVEFDTNGDGGDSYFPLPTDDANLNITDGKLVFTNGRDTNGGYKLSTQDLTGSVDLAGISDGIKYIGVDSLGNTVAYDNIPLFNTETGIMYANDGTTPLTNPICFLDDKPYQITSETPMSRLEDMESIPKNIMESTTVDGDLEVTGALTISETKWSNEDGVEYFDEGLLGVPDTTFSSTGARIYPDGTIRGKSSYGEYVKYIDGSLECSGVFTTSTGTTTAYGSLFRTAADNVSLPYEFIEKFKAFAQTDNAYFITGAGWINNSTLYSVTVHDASLAGTREVNFKVIGRWK